MFMQGWDIINSSPMFMKVKGGIGDVRRVELNDVVEIGIAQFLFFARKFSQVNDQDGRI